MSKINYSSLRTRDALITLNRSVSIFKKIIEKGKSLSRFDIPFSWEVAEERHVKAASADHFDCGFCYADRRKLFSLDLSKDIDSFGYNEEYFNNKYGSRMSNIWCCVVNEYEYYYEYDRIISEVVFLYDKETNEIVEILDLERRKTINKEEKDITRVSSIKRLEKILNESKSSQ